MYVDGSSRKEGIGVGIPLSSFENEDLECSTLNKIFLLKKGYALELDCNASFLTLLMSKFIFIFQRIT